MKKEILCGVLLMMCFTAGLAAEDVPQQFEGFNLQGFTDEGEKAWDVKGDTADIHDNTITISNVDANQYGEQEMNLKAKTGVIDKTSGNIHLEKDVVITSEAGSQLKTDTLDWEKDNDFVTTEDSVLLTDERLTATGTGLKARPGLKTAQMNEDVTVEFLTDAEKQDERIITIICDGPMEIDQARNKATFNKNVVATQTDRILKADKMEIYINPKTKKIQQMVCTGHVFISQGENASYSDRAVYYAKDQRMVLTGRPKLKMITEGEGGLNSLKK